jgi:hypothetical protein
MKEKMIVSRKEQEEEDAHSLLTNLRKEIIDVKSNN